jgi:hypothetical protein
VSKSINDDQAEWTEWNCCPMHVQALNYEWLLDCGSEV